MLMTIVWLAVGFLTGLLLLIFVPWAAARIAGPKYQEKVSDWYVWLAQTSISKCAIIVRDNQLELVPKRYDPEIGADRDSKHGERHHKDPLNVLGRLANKPFGIALSDRGVYISPLVAEVGDKLRDAKDRNEGGPSERIVEDGDGARREAVFRDGFEIPTFSTAVDLGAADYLITGSCEPEQGRESFTKTQISQEKFHERLSFGQSFFIVLSFLAVLVVSYWIADPEDGASVTVVDFLAHPESHLLALSVLAISLRGTWEWIDERVEWKVLQAAAFVAMIVVSIPLLAWWLAGALVGIAVFIVMVGTPLAIVSVIGLLGPSIPVVIGHPLSKGFWILAQLAVGRGALVRLESGRYVHRKLLDGNDADYRVDLPDGSTLDVEGDQGDLYRFGWAPLLVTEQKGEKNMAPISQEVPAASATDGGRVLANNRRQGYRPALSVPDSGWLVTLPQLWAWVSGSAESDMVERGRDNALTEHGGEQQVGAIVYMGVLAVLMITAAVLGLAAGGALI